MGGGFRSASHRRQGHMTAIMEREAVPVRARAARRRRTQLLTAAPFVLPGLLLVLLFVVWPLLRGMQMSMYDWNLAVPAPFQVR